MGGPPMLVWGQKIRIVCAGWPARRQLKCSSIQIGTHRRDAHATVGGGLLALVNSDRVRPDTLSTGLHGRAARATVRPDVVVHRKYMLRTILACASRVSSS